MVSLVSLTVANLLFQSIGLVVDAEFSVFLFLAFVWILVSYVRKDFDIGRTDEYYLTLKKLGITLFWFLAATAILWTPIQHIPIRWVPLLGLGMVLGIFMAMYRVLVHLLLRKYRAKGNDCHNAIIVGRCGTSPRLAEVLRIRKDFGIKFLGYFDDQADCAQTRGRIDDFFKEAPGLKLHIIYIQDLLDVTLVKKIIEFADENYIKVKMIPGRSLQLEKNLSFSKYGDLHVINVNEIPLDNALNSFGKRAFDVVFAGLTTVFILSWLIPLVGILIKLESRGPIFFVQKRNGLNNKVFDCLKFRSMTPNDYADTLQATKNDPRVTRIGAFLRRTSLDEMPQFLNVLMGDMSIVGPRPHSVPMNQSFKTQLVKYNSRHKIRPGITGLAQVRGFRGEIENSFQIRSRVRLDSFYVNNWSFLLDIGIMANTVRELLFHRENAY
ncbi:undecaprenyl-phosphate glucose phosphotransferase [Algoriphagus jejuensis]|uniref:Undecaprenyl-phosphate glucose phosphotransferase n=1 Tax=Algoriphagus jejuensis TaxID=419934 RepID=A0ABN1N078_9BACT